MIKILELFGGIGAPRKALVNLGVEHKSIDYVEWNEKAVRTYNAMFDNRYKAESVVGYSLQPDILVHGSPCQDFSIGGKQYGGNVEDGTRSSLMFETLKIIENLGLWKPKVVIWENVKNVLSKKHMPAFQRYLNDLEKLGYKNSFEVLDARDFGIPQARERVFTISLLDGSNFDFGKLRKTKMKKVSDFLQTSATDLYRIKQPSMLKRLPGMPKASATFNGSNMEEIKDYALTITTKQDRCPNSGVIRLPNNDFRYLTELECWRLMGFDDEDYKRAANEHPVDESKMNRTLYHQAGNSIVVQILESIFELLLSGDYAAEDVMENKNGQLEMSC